MGSGKRGEFKSEGTISSADLVRTSHDRMISLGKQFAITQGICNVKNRGEIEESIAYSGLVQPANCEVDGRTPSANILYDVQDAGRATVRVNNGKRDDQRAIKDADGMDDASTSIGVVLCSNDNKDDAREGNELGDGKEYANWAVEEDVSSDEDGCRSDDVFHFLPLENSSHRDGSIYKVTGEWQTIYRIADLNESK